MLDPSALSGEDIRHLVAALDQSGYGDDVSWSETIQPPATPAEFAQEAIFVICNSGMKHTVATGIFDRVMKAIRAGKPAGEAFGHVGKTNAIDYIWLHQEKLFHEFLMAENQVDYCASLPWIGGITKYHLAKNFGVDCAKPDVHLQRLADAHGETVDGLCQRLAKQTGYRVATVDVILWRACAIGLIDPKTAARRT